MPQSGDTEAPVPQSPQPPPPPERCEWCSAIIPEGAARCPSCQAAVESDAVASAEIPGVTAIDPNVIADEASARRQLNHTRQQSGHMLGPALGIVGGGLIGHVVGNAIEDLWKAKAPGPSYESNAMGPYDLLALERKPCWWAEGATDQQAAPPSDQQAAPPSDQQPAPPPGQLADPWVDLPPPSIQDQIAGTEYDPWAQPEPPAPEFDPWAVDGGPWSQSAKQDNPKPPR